MVSYTLLGTLGTIATCGEESENDWPVFTEDPTEVYEREEIDKFLAACDETEKVTFSFLLQTGLPTMNK